MGYARLVSLAVVWGILDECLPGYEKRESDHYWRIKCGKKVYPRLPLGEHGARKPSRTDVEVGYLRKVFRFFEIEECALPKLQALGK